MAQAVPPRAAPANQPCPGEVRKGGTGAPEVPSSIPQSELEMCLHLSTRKPP